MTTTIRDMYRIGHLSLERSNRVVTDSEGRRLSKVSVNLRTGRFSVLRKWQDADGWEKSDVVVVDADYPVTITEMEATK